METNADRTQLGACAAYAGVTSQSHQLSHQPLDESLRIGWTVLGNVIANRLKLRPGLWRETIGRAAFFARFLPDFFCIAAYLARRCSIAGGPSTEGPLATPSSQSLPMLSPSIRRSSSLSSHSLSPLRMTSLVVGS